MNHSRLETYLDELERPLTALGETARREWREEARQHLADLTAAHEELGTDPDTALEQALHQFGEAAKVGQAVRRESYVPFSWVPALLRAAVLAGIVWAGGAALVGLARLAFAPAPLTFLDRTSGGTVACYAVLGGLTTFFAARRKPLAWPLAGACVASVIAPLVAHILDPFTGRSMWSLEYLFLTDILQVLGYGLPAGAFIWARRVRPRRAVLGTGLFYLTSMLGVFVVMVFSRHSLNDILHGLRVPLTAIVFWGLQGVLVGGLLGVTRQVAGSISERVRRRFKQGSFARFMAG